MERTTIKFIREKGPRYFRKVFFRISSCRVSLFWVALTIWVSWYKIFLNFILWGLVAEFHVSETTQPLCCISLLLIVIIFYFFSTIGILSVLGTCVRICERRMRLSQLWICRPIVKFYSGVKRNVTLLGILYFLKCSVFETVWIIFCFFLGYLIIFN